MCILDTKLHAFYVHTQLCAFIWSDIQLYYNIIVLYILFCKGKLDIFITFVLYNDVHGYNNIFCVLFSYLTKQ